MQKGIDISDRKIKFLHASHDAIKHAHRRKIVGGMIMSSCVGCPWKEASHTRVEATDKFYAHLNQEKYRKGL